MMTILILSIKPKTFQLLLSHIIIIYKKCVLLGLTNYSKNFLETSSLTPNDLFDPPTKLTLIIEEIKNEKKKKKMKWREKADNVHKFISFEAAAARSARNSCRTRKKKNAEEK